VQHWALYQQITSKVLVKPQFFVRSSRPRLFQTGTTITDGSTQSTLKIPALKHLSDLFDEVNTRLRFVRPQNRHASVFRDASEHPSYVECIKPSSGLAIEDLCINQDGA